MWIKNKLCDFFFVCLIDWRIWVESTVTSEFTHVYNSHQKIKRITTKQRERARNKGATRNTNVNEYKTDLETRCNGFAIWIWASEINRIAFNIKTKQRATDNTTRKYLTWNTVCRITRSTSGNFSGFFFLPLSFYLNLPGVGLFTKKNTNNCLLLFFGVII